MKIALICPSNILYMPYVNNYIKVLDSREIDYKIINWDRFNIIEEVVDYSYKDKKTGHRRNYYDYYKYKNHVVDILSKEKFDKIIIFTLQLGHFFKRHLIKNYKDKYILDIRDYNKIFKISNFNELIASSYSTVISSPGYKEWLPKSNKYYVNHNTNATNLKKNGDKKEKVIEKTIISTIGVIRHWDINKDFVNSLQNESKFELVFHGEGTINKKLENYTVKNNINNVSIYGRYKKEDEGSLYEKSDMISVLLYKKHINSRTALANRLYNAIIYGKPLLSLEGTFMSELIEKYDLGLVIKSLDNIQNDLDKYIVDFDKDKYNDGRSRFFKTVLNENNKFLKRLEKFVSF